MYKKRHTAEAYNSILGIPQTSTVTILGLTFQSNCKFSTHLKEKLCKAKSGALAREARLRSTMGK